MGGSVTMNEPRVPLSTGVPVSRTADGVSVSRYGSSRSFETPVLSVQGVHKWLGGGHVLRGVDLDVQRGSTAVIIGPSGSGKSTLLRCINHLDPVDAGQILLNGELIGYDWRGDVLYERPDRDVAVMRRRIGMVFQQFNLFRHKTAQENVAYGPRQVLRLSPDLARERAIATLAQVGLEKVADSYPAHLPGGQQQRVGIARALAMEPELMLFDEPTSSLDPELVGEVLAVIRDLAAHGMTAVVVTHEIDFAREVGDILVVLNDGSVIEHGACAEELDTPRHPRTRIFLSRIQGRSND
jgi:polar amino acid transport system ATP-binding protein